MTEDIRETIKTTMRLNEPEQTLQAAKDAAKRLFEVADAILDELAKAGEPKPKEDDDKYEPKPNKEDDT